MGRKEKKKEKRETEKRIDICGTSSLSELFAIEATSLTLHVYFQFQIY